MHKDGSRSLVIKAVDNHKYRQRVSSELDGDIETVKHRWQQDRMIDLIPVRTGEIVEALAQSRKIVYAGASPDAREAD